MSYGCKVAWRNSNRCINRIQWNKMHVIDKRDVNTTEGCFQSIVEHVREAVTDGVIKTVITLFPQVQPNQIPIKIWNSQVFAYAGYEDGLGDPAQLEFTKCLMDKGWIPPEPRTNWDVLPLAIQKSDDDIVDLYTLPEDIVHQVSITSSSHPKINELDLKWFAIPLISNFLLDLGGVYYQACPFNGWFMETEIVRDLADVQRYNLMPKMADLLGMPKTNISLWKDECQMILAKAVLESFQKSGYSMVDHHSASDGFIRFYNKEMKTRGYCPGDWGWIVPPIGGSTTKVFHQEMLNYQLKPMYRVQPVAQNIYKFDKLMNIIDPETNVMEIKEAPVVKEEEKVQPEKKVELEVTHNIKPTTTDESNDMESEERKGLILFATETGKSEDFANLTKEKLENSYLEMKVMDMNDFEWTMIQNKNQYDLYIVTSTFGQGEAPANGTKVLNELSNSTSLNLKNVRYAVFGLGNSNYENFNQCAKDFDTHLEKNSALRYLEPYLADEVQGEHDIFDDWIKSLKSSRAIRKATLRPRAQSTLKNTLQDIKISVESPKKQNRADRSSISSVRSQKGNTRVKVAKRSFIANLVDYKDISSSCYEVTLDLKNCPKSETDEFGNKIFYSPGDRLAVWPKNDESMVNRLCDRLGYNSNATLSSILPEDYDLPQEQKNLSVFEYLHTFKDLSGLPNKEFILMLSNYASDEHEYVILSKIATMELAYTKWKEFKPTSETLLKEFTSIRNIPFEEFITALRKIEPRFYSISSSQQADRNDQHFSARIAGVSTGTECTLTISKNTFKSGKSRRKGLCTDYLSRKPAEIEVMVSRNSTFHLPQQTSTILMFCTGTGVAPFKGFWEENSLRSSPHTLVLVQGANKKENMLYKSEIDTALQDGVIAKHIPVYSRELEIQDKTYIQDIIDQNQKSFFDLIHLHKASVYVCGSQHMGDSIRKSLVESFQIQLNISGDDALFMLKSLKKENRYHEDIFTTATVTVKGNGQDADSLFVVNSRKRKTSVGTIIADIACKTTLLERELSEEDDSLSNKAPRERKMSISAKTQLLFGGNKKQKNSKGLKKSTSIKDLNKKAADSEESAYSSESEFDSKSKKNNNILKKSVSIEQIADLGPIQDRKQPSRLRLMMKKSTSMKF
eukprot:Pgem_evm1s4028